MGYFFRLNNTVNTANLIYLPLIRKGANDYPLNYFKQRKLVQIKSIAFGSHTTEFIFFF